MNEETGNLEKVRNALHGITGVPLAAPVVEPDWYLVMARTNHELDTVDSFRRNSFAAYWPSYEMMVVTRQKHEGRLVRKLKRVGILPGYVFSSIEPNRDFTAILHRIVGAFDIVRTFSGNPLLIGDADVRIIRRIEIGLNTPHPEKVSHTFKRGYRVRFVDDLIGRWPPGVIDTLATDGRISVEVDLMGRKLPIWVLPHQIEKT